MKQRTRRLYYKRMFLNKPRVQGSAFLLGEVTQVASRMSIWRNGKRVKGESRPNVEVEAGLSLSDCSRQITLEFSVFGDPTSRNFQRDKANVLHKAHALRDQVNLFVEALEIALDVPEE